MAFKLTQFSRVDHNGGNSTFNLSSFYNQTAAGSPKYLVVTALDRNEYTASATGATGAFTGNGATLKFSAIGGDARGAGIVFSLNAAGQYVNGTYGALSHLAYTDSGSPNDVTSLSFFGTSYAGLAQAYENSAYSLAAFDAGGYLGSITIATIGDIAHPPLASAPLAGGAPSQATPDGVAAAALAMVGQAWNDEGCWVLASTIAAEAGAGLPIQTTAIDQPGAANGEWVVVYNGPAGSTGNWQAQVSAGEMVSFATSANSGHITTCVSGSGATAMLVDNIAYIGRYGAITNSAHDGSANDVTIAAPHAAAQEFAGISGATVVIYALDTPAITDRVASETLAGGSTVALSGLFAASDPAHKAITAYQIYNTAGADSIVVNGHAITGSSAAAPITVGSLAGVVFEAGSLSAADTLEIRASNGLYWGDWQSLDVHVQAPAATVSGIGGTHVMQDAPLVGGLIHALGHFG